MDLDQFVAQAVEIKKTKAATRRRSSRPKSDDTVSRTKEFLRELALEACEPTEVVLMTTHQECECGSHFESVNNVPLVKCVGPTVTHFKQVKSFKDMANYDRLPRTIETRTVLVPYCEDCFVNARQIALPAEDSVWAELMQETRSDG